MAATIKDIAEETGLGLATISSYINGGHLREKNRVRIEEAIKKLHYEVNETARGLKTNRTKTIGVVIPELNNTFCAEVLTSMTKVWNDMHRKVREACTKSIQDLKCDYVDMYYIHWPFPNYHVHPAVRRHPPACPSSFRLYFQGHYQSCLQSPEFDEGS